MKIKKTYQQGCVLIYINKDTILVFIKKTNDHDDDGGELSTKVKIVL